MYELIFTDEASDNLHEIERDPSKIKLLKSIRKALGYMETNLRHPSLNTHQYYSIQGPQREKVFEAYVQQKTPGAYRIFWYYGPQKNQLTVMAIVPHPD